MKRWKAALRMDVHKQQMVVTLLKTGTCGGAMYYFLQRRQKGMAALTAQDFALRCKVRKKVDI